VRRRVFILGLFFTSLGALEGCSESDLTVASDAMKDAATDAFIPGVEGTPIVQGALWEAVTGVDDPFSELRGDAERCSVEPFQEEYGGVEIDTTDCKHVTLRQDGLAQVSRGSRIRVIAWHSQLYDPDTRSAFGYMSITLGDTALWSVERPIPGPASSWDFVVEATSDFEVGTPVYLHVRNHGANNWNLHSLTLVE
jgi:hypothetical protein